MVRQRLYRHSCKSTRKEPEADQARQKLAAIHSDYRAELGTFHNERAAQRKRSELRSQFAMCSQKSTWCRPIPPTSAIE